MPAATELRRTNAKRLVLLEPEPTEHTENATMMPCCVSCVYDMEKLDGPESCLCTAFQDMDGGGSVSPACKYHVCPSGRVTKTTLACIQSASLEVSPSSSVMGR